MAAVDIHQRLAVLNEAEGRADLAALGEIGREGVAHRLEAGGDMSVNIHAHGVAR